MRLVFISSTVVGGSGRSQRELAAQLVRRGHQVRFVVDDHRRGRLIRWLSPRFAALARRAAGTPASATVGRLASLPGRRSRPESIGGLQHRCTAVPENALESELNRFAPDVVVANSLDLGSWRRTVEICTRRRIPTVLYIREQVSLMHMSEGAVPGAIVANSASLAAAIRAQGFACELIPSVVDFAVTRTESSRQVALAINPTESRGIDMVWSIAARMPHIRFIVQESWTLPHTQVRDIEAHVGRLPNVEFRRAIEPGPALYSDARVLLVPHRVDNRPRVIAEAFANGIPAIVSDLPGLVEAAGEVGIRVAADDVDGWCDAVQQVWSDAAEYERLVDAALAGSKQLASSVGSVVDTFEAVLHRLVRPDDATFRTA